MDPLIVKALVDLGVMGPFVALFAWYIWQKDKELKEARVALADANAARTEDMKQVVEKLVHLNDKWAGVLEDNTRALERSRFTLKAILRAVEREDGERNSHATDDDRDSDAPRSNHKKSKATADDSW